MREVTVWYLESHSEAELDPAENPGGIEIREARVKQYQFNRFLYQFVGASWAWTDKLSWTEDKWKAYAENENLRTWVAYCKGSPAGYFELQRQDRGDVEIAYFGLAPRFIGQGFGGYLLSQTIESAWAWEGTKRVWVHTCTLDHPSALQNYKSRGMEVYSITTT